jgi:hypothetical protein
MTDSLFDHPADIPVTPYAGSSGWSGSETSQARADEADASGLTGERDRSTLALLRASGRDGITWFELAEAEMLHHGEASAALSRLHKVGAAARLTEQRGKSQVYVLPDNVDGRDTSPFRPNVSRTRVLDLLAEVDDLLRTNRVGDARSKIEFARRYYSGT